MAQINLLLPGSKNQTDEPVGNFYEAGKRANQSRLYRYKTGLLPNRGLL
jgi:hypothetical protein